MSNTNCKNMENSNNCNYCDSSYSCYSCKYCYSCYSCNYCDSCDYCDSCYSCKYCYSCYSCNFSYGLRMSEDMIFCLGEGKYISKGEGYQKNLRIFNKDVSEEVYKKAINSKPVFELPIAKWVKAEDMTKEETTTARTQMGGYLKTLSWNDAWAEGWKNASKEFKAWVLGLPGFDAEIFYKITGIKDVNVPSLKGKKVEVKLDGVTYTATID